MVFALGAIGCVSGSGGGAGTFVAQSTDASGSTSDSGASAAAGDAASGAGTNNNAVASAGCGKKSGLPAGGVQQSLDAGSDGDGKRGYWLSLPKNYDPNVPHKLIVGYPGTNWVGKQIQPYLKMESGKNDEIFVYPDPLLRQFKGWGEFGGWVLGPHATPAQGMGDLVFTAKLLEHLGNTLCVDEKRVFATGHSWGGDMAQVVACFLGDKFRASAPIAANRPYWFEPTGGGGPKCKGKAAVWTFFGQGDDHFKNQKYVGEFGDQCRDFWLKLRGCDGETSSTDLGHGADGECVAYKGCGAGVRYCIYGKQFNHQKPSYFAAAVMPWFRSL